MPRDELVSTSGMTANQWNLGALPLEEEEEEEETEGDEEEEEEKVMPSPVNAALQDARRSRRQLPHQPRSYPTKALGQNVL